jgi:hypothetical protein
MTNIIYVNPANINAKWPPDLELFDFRYEVTEVFLLECHKWKEYEEFLDWMHENNIVMTRTIKHCGMFFDPDGDEYDANWFEVENIRQTMKHRCIGKHLAPGNVILEFSRQDAMLVKLSW